VRLSPLEARLDALERAINAKMELLLGAADIARVVAGVTGLAAQVRQKQHEIDDLRRQVEDEKAKAATPVVTGNIDQMRRELDGLRQSSGGLERQAADGDAKIVELEQTLNQSAESAKARAKTLIKRMMDAVFQDTAAMFEGRRQYSGREVGDQLKVMLRKHSLNCLNDINQNGLF
jgi:predicted  nucleic acid-binding Zn-ribbon protein